MRHPLTTRRLALIAIPIVLAGLAAGLHAVALPPQDEGQRITAPEGPTVDWKAVDTLISEQKFEAAPRRSPSFARPPRRQATTLPGPVPW
jgi:hypothetical protein